MMEKYNGETDKQVYEIHEGDTIISKIKDLKTSQDTDNSLFEGLSGSLVTTPKTTITQATDQIYKCVDDFERAEQYVLRFDLTVPFSRFVKGSDCNKLIRFQVGTVYRKDQPNMKNGRFREFLQLDFDILTNEADPIAANAEVLDALYSMLCALDLQKFVIKINSRSILSDLFRYCKIPDILFRPICSSIDKLDKHDWKYVKKDMESKGLSEDTIDVLQETMTSVKKASLFQSNFEQIPFFSEKSKMEMRGLRDNLNFRLSGSYAKIFVLDISLARGLDYYTSLIFEAQLSTSKGKMLGSIAGGGRYDELCGVKCVGFSIGIDRLLSYLEKEKLLTDQQLAPTYDFWIIQVGDKLKPETEGMLFQRRQEVVKKFRQFNWKAGTELRKSAGLGNQMKLALKMRVPYVIFIGEQEYNSEKMSIKLMNSREQYDMLTFAEIVQVVANK